MGTPNLCLRLLPYFLISSSGCICSLPNRSFRCSRLLMRLTSIPLITVIQHPIRAPSMAYIPCSTSAPTLIHVVSVLRLVGCIFFTNCDGEITLPLSRLILTPSLYPATKACCGELFITVSE